MTFNGLGNEFKGLYDRNDFERALFALKKSEGRSDHASKVRIMREMLDASGISYESSHEGSDSEYFERLLEEAYIPTTEDLQNRILYALYNKFDVYPTPETYMKRIVDRLSAEEDDWGDDTLRLRILKQFVKYGNGLKDAGYGGAPAVRKYAKEKGFKSGDTDLMLSFVDDGIFGLLDGANREQTRPKGTYGLLKAADDIALGKFRTEGATRKLLYLFAMAYNMTFYSGDSRKRTFDPVTDINKNLFRDYYTNNFIRFITDSYKGRLNEYELDPSGQGINFENYAEIIYIYFINKDMPAADKIRCASAMIDRIRKKMKGKGAPAGIPERMDVDDVMDLEEDALEEYLCEEYNCDASKVNDTPIMLEVSQKDAFEAYDEIREKILELDTRLENCNYGLWFTDVAGFYTRNKGYAIGNYEVEEEKAKQFIELLDAVNNYLGVTQKEVEIEIKDEESEDAREWTELSIAKTKALFIENPERVTRAAIIVAFYYYYNQLHIDDDAYGSMSFEEFFNDFKDEVDIYLNRAHYNTFSGKDLFDMLTVFSSYSYIYM